MLKSEFDDIAKMHTWFRKVGNETVDEELKADWLSTEELTRVEYE